MMVSTIDPIKADPNPSTVKPFNILPANIKRIAFITKVNNPSVRIVIGSVSKSNTGLIRAFISPMTATAIIADLKSARWTPWTIRETRKSANALTTQFARIFNIL